MKYLRLGAILAVIVAGAGFAVSSLTPRTPPPERSLQAQLWNSPPPAQLPTPSVEPGEDASAPLEGGAPASSLTPFPSAMPKEEPPIKLDDFLGMLDERTPKQVSARVANEFNKSSVLKESFKKFKKKHGGAAPARQFVDYVTRIPQFRQLMAKFRGDPSFKAAYADAAKDRQMNDVLRSGLNAGPARPTTGPGPIRGGEGARRTKGLQAVDAEAVAREWKEKARSGIDSGGAGAPQGHGAGASVGQASAMGGLWTQSHDAKSGTIGGGGGHLASGPGMLMAGPKEHDVESLKEIQKAGPASFMGENLKENEFQSRGKFFTEFLKAFHMHDWDGYRKQIEAAFGDADNPDDLWGSCFATGNYTRCKTVFDELPADVRMMISDVPQSYFEACGSERYGSKRSGNPSECIRLCLDNFEKDGCLRPPSASDKKTWDEQCRKGPDAGLDPGHCLDTQYYGEPVFDEATGELKETFGSRGQGGGEAKVVRRKPTEKDCVQPNADALRAACQKMIDEADKAAAEAEAKRKKAEADKLALQMEQYQKDLAAAQQAQMDAELKAQAAQDELAKLKEQQKTAKKTEETQKTQEAAKTAEDPKKDQGGGDKAAEPCQGMMDCGAKCASKGNKACGLICGGLGALGGGACGLFGACGNLCN